MPSQYIFGFPHIMGGGIDETGIYCSIFGNKKAPTMLGGKDGKITSRIKRIAKTMEQANLNPQISTQILPWILTHYAEAAGLLGGVMKADSGKAFGEGTEVMKYTLLAIREGLDVCKARGINVGSIKPQNLYYLPKFIIYSLTIWICVNNRLKICGISVAPINFKPIEEAFLSIIEGCPTGLRVDALKPNSLGSLLIRAS
ncbi:hypothetical protein [Clostridium pasteurianum]|uniref:hypothetical protein n=1 Tax=Clostridium pasteurianum TaxID=1501 RepID=UPI00128FA7F5|nr:hypothetical protein [Clostridium pasteurianum]